MQGRGEVTNLDAWRSRHIYKYLLEWPKQQTFLLEEVFIMHNDTVCRCPDLVEGRAPNAQMPRCRVRCTVCRRTAARICGFLSFSRFEGMNDLNSQVKSRASCCLEYQ